jgi:hypothetical protein
MKAASFDPVRCALAVSAAAGPSLLAYNVSPSPTFWNQALAVALWGWFVVASSMHGGPGGRGLAPLQAALAVMAMTVLASWWPGSLPAGLALSALGLLLASAVLVASGGQAHSDADPAALFGDFCLGWAVAGAVNIVIAAVQVFWPDLPDGDWIAHSGIPGRAVGNLRQPNHLSSLLVWSAIAVVGLFELRRLAWRWAAPLFGAMVFAVVLSASRTGAISMLLLALWGLLDRRLSRRGRALLIAAPLIYGLAWLGMAEWAKLSAQTFGGAVRLGEADVSGSRYGIWKNTLAMIRQQPWLGTGFGEFNFAWSLTPFPGRPVAFFDHTHNLPLQLAAEIGLPLAGLVLALLLWALWRAARVALRDPGDTGLARRCALMMVLMIGLHSLLEYPLWYSYFLLPTAWAWAFAGGQAPAEGVKGTRDAQGLAAGGMLLVVIAVFSVFDYTRVTAIFSAAEDGTPLEQRIARGQHSLLFAHHADYAAATTDIKLADDLQPFQRAPHYLLDTRLMMAWAKVLERHGHVDEARAIAERLREFHNAGSDEFFAACQAADGAEGADAFQCQAPSREPDWREYLNLSR